MSEYEILTQRSWFSKHPKAIMFCGAFLAGLVMATIIVVPATLALSYPEHPWKPDVHFNAVNLPNSPLRVAAFNVKSYGEAKSQDKFAFEHLVKILSRYDVVLIQEVRDKCGKSLRKLWQSLNETGNPYGFVESERLGRTSYTEQYVFFYRIHKAELLGTLQYNDSKDDVFEREPFTIELSYYSLQDKRKKRITLLALHTKPRDTPAELAKLPSIMKLSLRHFKHSHGIIALGDFNADCTYLSRKKKGAMELFHKDAGFRSLIGDSEDTTASSSTDCAYDRAFVYGEGVKVGKARVFNFQTAFSLNESDARKISDHYPIEFTLL